MNVRRLSTVLGVVLGVASGPAFSVENLFSPVSNRSDFARQGELLRQVMADPANARVEIVAANAALVNRSASELQLNLTDGLVVVARQTSFEVMESGNEVWIGDIDAAVPLGSAADADDLGGTTPLDASFDNIIIVRSKDTLLGTIRIAGELYRLVPIDSKAHALVEVDQSKFLPDEDERAYREMQKASFDHGAEPADPGVTRAISTIRVMVAFGPAATAAIGNEQQAMDLAFAESNQALATTNTDIRFQQAGSIRYYTQSESTNYSTMLSRLTNGSDGYYDAIAGQRNSSTADMVAYIAPQSSTLCGQAAGIATSNASAYFVMSPSCLSGNFTFVHEAAHVVGARHDNDPTLTPYAYGHGYVITSKSRRTVMAVNNGPCPSCTRLGAFSSPNYTLGGTPIGTASRNDNNRVWRTRGPTVAAFR